MTTQPAAQTGYTGAWRWGLLFGILQPALYYSMRLMLGYLLPGMSELMSNLVDIVLFGLGLLLCGCAGYIAARKSGNRYTGNSAGLYAGLVNVTISLTIGFLLLYSIGGSFRDLLLRYPSFLIAIAVASGCVIVLYGLLALIAGVIGGKLAQRNMAKAG